MYLVNLKWDEYIFMIVKISAKIDIFSSRRDIVYMKIMYNAIVQQHRDYAKAIVIQSLSLIIHSRSQRLQTRAAKFS